MKDRMIQYNCIGLLTSCPQGHQQIFPDNKCFPLDRRSCSTYREEHIPGLMWLGNTE